MYYPSVRYYLSNPEKGRVELKHEPIGWDEDRKELVRSSKYYGVFTQLSSNLEFVKDGASFISDVYYSSGTESSLTLERYVYEGIQKGYQLEYIGNLDLKTYSQGDNRVKIQFLSGGLKSLVESQFDEEYELERTTDIKGNPITPLEYDVIDITGRRIFLESLLRTPEEFNGATWDSFVIQAFEDPGSAQAFGAWGPVKLNLIYESDDNVQMQSNPVSNNSVIWDTNNIGQGTEDLFYAAERESEKKFIIDIFFRIKELGGEFFYDPFISVWLLVFERNQDGTVGAFLRNESERLINVPIVQGETIAHQETIIKNLPENRCLSLAYETTAWEDLPGAAGVISYTNITIDKENNSLTIEEDSFFPATKAKVIRTFDVGERMVEIFTGEKKLFDSSFFGATSDGYIENGDFERTCITSGMHLRQFPTEHANPNDQQNKDRLAKITLAFKDVFGLNNYFNLGWGIKNQKGIEKVVLEPKEYFFQKKIGIKLGEVSSLNISVDEKKLFRSMTFGNETAGTYEELHGLQEVNAKTTYISYLTTADEAYDVTGNIRADLVGMEYARRSQFQDFPKEDTAYDKEKWIFHLDNTKPILRKWDADFISEPIIYDPESAGNLMLTPFRSMERHSSFFNAGLTRSMEKKTRYSSGTGDVEVATQLPDEPQRYENSDIINFDMKIPMFKAEFLEFEKPLTSDLHRKIIGETDGIPNVYLLVNFTFKGSEYNGWITSLKMNDPGNWKLLKAEL